MLQTTFFNSVGSDQRSYDAGDFARFFARLASNGVLMNGDANALKCAALPNTALVNVADGAALVNGYSALVTGENVSVAPGAALPRADRIVLRLDLNQMPPIVWARRRVRICRFAQIKTGGTPRLEASPCPNVSDSIKRFRSGLSNGR
jgi:hypothetical protein